VSDELQPAHATTASATSVLVLRIPCFTTFSQSAHQMEREPSEGFGPIHAPNGRKNENHHLSEDKLTITTQGYVVNEPLTAKARLSQV